MQFYLFAATAFSLLASVHAAADLTAEALAMGIDELSGLSNKTDILLQPMTADNVTAVMPASNHASHPIMWYTDRVSGGGHESPRHSRHWTRVCGEAH